MDYDWPPLKHRGPNEDIVFKRLYQSLDLYSLVSKLGDFQVVDTGANIFEAEPSGSVRLSPKRRLSIVDPLDGDLRICNGARTAVIVYDTLQVRIAAPGEP